MMNKAATNNTIIEVKKVEKKTINYTQRRKINLKDCKVKLNNQPEDFLQARVELDWRNITLNDNNILVFEAIYKTFYERRDIADQTDNMTIDLEEFPKDASPSFRLKVISKGDDDEGQIISATKFFKAVKNENDKESDVSFLKYSLSTDLGDQIYWIDWTDKQNPAIKINKSFEEKFSLKTDSHAQAYLYPSLVRQILTGFSIAIQSEKLETRNHVDERSSMDRWLRFCEQRLKLDVPDEEHWDNLEAWMDFIDSVVKKFCGIKWDKRRTLLQKLISN